MGFVVEGRMDSEAVPLVRFVYRGDTDDAHLLLVLEDDVERRVRPADVETHSLDTDGHFLTVARTRVGVLYRFRVSCRTDHG